MQQKITVIYAYRNRDFERVRLSLQSLQNQSNQNFEVQFIDYGSEQHFAKSIKDVVESYSFATYHYVAHKGLLWNKSKALNYGISQTESDYVVLSDIDVVFATHFIDYCLNIAKPNQFLLFKIGYLPKDVEANQIEERRFLDLKPTHFGDTFGIGLFYNKALKEVKGLDPFFHFYGSEDEDLNSRLIEKGYTLNRCEENLLLHQWHPRFAEGNDDTLSVVPRLKNIQRINQRHYLWNKALKHTKHRDVKNWNHVYTMHDESILNKPETTLFLNTIKAHVTHFLDYGINDYYDKVIKVVFKEDDYYRSLKYKAKTLLHKETQPYVSLKYVNDRLLEAIIFKYRHANYAFYVVSDKKEIHFTIDLKTI
ncbi:glycosyltransferase family 2 protein [Ichthyenterobacterium magnum]|uniref:Galactosyltransferase-like protein n=1 Tax=Ichthyenterobacterium magnum TaxID=1230530 RepID=A0A420DV00_9FLAO|nr:glycosyltransferase [Ichthyenterobacterium magnum]RKE97980.1 galactosyltransferase-like protein [Ichthyenterobacterium magnum]